MESTGLPDRRHERGFSLIEAMIVVAIVALVSSIAIPTFKQALDKSRRSAIIADSSELYRAMMRYYVDESVFPAAGGGPPEETFDPITLAPLTTDGYFRGAQGFINKLYRGRVLVYIAFDVGEARNEFFAILASKDIRTVIVVAHTQFLPWGVAGDWYDGVYEWNGTKFVPIQARNPRA